MSRMWITRYMLLLTLFSFATCTPFQQKQPHEIRQSARNGIVTGASSRDQNGNVFIRREIRDLEANYPDQWNLYLRAMEALQSDDEADPYSYFGIASIHGRPYTTWENARGLDYKIGTAGYCPHSNELFLGWHRPYLSLFEEALAKHVWDIASNAPADQSERYLAAANEFRIPYWDWAQGTKTGPFPAFLTTERIWVTDTDGSQAEIHNPLYSYRFKTIPDNFDKKWRYINETVRWPTGDDPWSTSQPWMIDESFEGQSNNLVSAVGTAFRSSDFGRFALNLESPHGWVHGVVGGGYNKAKWPYEGQLWPLEYSSYEPVFMLHHANVDRLFALYQAAHPDSWMQTSNIGDNGNVYLANYQDIDANTPLLPFRKTNDAFWTTNDCRDTTVLGYAYPETQRWQYDSAEALAEAAQSVISNLYSGRTRELLTASQQVMGDTETTPNLLGKNNSFTDWNVETHAPSSSLPASFILRFSFIGAFQSDPSVEVGSWMHLSPSSSSSSSSSSDKDTSLAAEIPSPDILQGTTSLTSHLIEQVYAGKLESLDARDVVPFLRDGLTWHVFDGEGTRIPNENLAGLEVVVSSTLAWIPDMDGMPVVYSEEKTLYPEITLGKMGR